MESLRKRDILGEIALNFIDSILGILSRREDNNYTAKHCIKVGLLAGVLGKSLNLENHDIKELQLAGRAHDIGKLAWPDTCFTKAKKERLGITRNMMLYHPTIGKQLLYNSLAPLDRRKRKCKLKWTYWIWFHHWGYTEEYRKYPPLTDPEVQVFLKCLNDNCNFLRIIELGIGIMYVADCFHAAISKRDYRGTFPMGKSIEDILKYMTENTGKEFHPEVVKKMVELKPWLQQTFINE